MFANRYFPVRFFNDGYFGTVVTAGVYINSPATGVINLVTPGRIDFRRAPLVVG